MMRFWILFAVAFMAHVASAATKKIENDEDRMAVLDRGRFIFGAASTTTYTSIVATTSTVFLSCLSATAATVCERRKRWARPHLKNLRKEIAVALADTELETSLDPSEVPDYASNPEEAGKQDLDDGKLALTVWTTTRVSTTVTVFYTNTSTTVTLSFGCVVGGMIRPTQRC
ncbi:uncharacterized protein LOC135196240 [Macrobrachium nipponense]|uniref:uncharacterized protein LOC135196240 n=1 Tax=Macrobrachium nipponense TaxID=159736 RepID=UPI0030C8D388